MNSDTQARLIRQNFFVVFLMYLFKSASKLIVGIHFGSAALISDGVHNINDILQFIGINLALKFTRKPDPEKYPVGKFALESVVSIIIGASLVWVGLQFLWSGMLKILSVVGFTDWLAQFVPPAAELLGTESVSLPVMPYIVALTVLGSAILSFFVYRYEMGIAKSIKSSPIEDDARELRADMWIEIVVGLGLLLGSVFQFSLADPILSVAVSVLVVHSGYEIIKERTLSLLNRAIESGDRERVLSALKSIEGVSAEDIEIKQELKAYFLCQGAVRVEAVLPLRVASSEGISQVLNVAKSRIKTVLSPKYGDVYVFLNHRLLRTEDSQDYLCRSIDSYLRNIWEINSRHGEDSHALMEDYVKSNFTALLARKSPAPQEDGLVPAEPLKDELYAQYLVAKGHLFSNGPLAEPTRQACAYIRKQLLCKSLNENSRLAIQNSLCEFEIESAIKGRASDGASVADTRNTLAKAFENAKLDPQLRAEAAHLLARSYYKLSDYNLEQARKWFQSAKEMHLLFPDSLFADRALTDWGNFEAQVLRLDDAETYLNHARLLKERKGDQHGLAIIYGCLANVHSRRGDFEKALQCFQKDLEIVRQLDIKGDIPHVSFKVADLLVKRGLLNNESDSLKEALVLLSAFEQIEPMDFFALKALFKAHFGLRWLNPDDTDSLDRASSMEAALTKLTKNDQNLYKKAILNRISGRVAAADQRWQDSLDLFEASARCFSGVEGPKDLPIQATLSQIEGLRWSAFAKSDGWTYQLEATLRTLEQQCQEVNLDLSSYLLPLTPKYLKKTEDKIHRLNEIDKQAGNLFGGANPILRSLDRLIWFLEL